MRNPSRKWWMILLIVGLNAIAADARAFQISIGSGDVQNLTLSALFMKLMQGADGEKREKLLELAERAKELGLTDAKQN